MANLNYERLLFNSIKNGQQPVRSVYDIWLDLGNTGTPEEFINSLKGAGVVVVNNVTIPTTAWVFADGLYTATIANENITANDVVNFNFTKDYINDAVNSGILGYNNTIDGGFEIFSNFAPSVNLVMDYSIISA